MGFLIEAYACLRRYLRLRRHAPVLNRSDQVTDIPGSYADADAVSAEVTTTHAADRDDQVCIDRSLFETGRLNGLTATAMLTYLELCATNTNGDPSATPPTCADVSARVERSPRMVRYALDELVAEGLVDERDDTPARYTLAIPPHPPRELRASHYRARATDCIHDPEGGIDPPPPPGKEFPAIVATEQKLVAEKRENTDGACATWRYPETRYHIRSNGGLIETLLRRPITPEIVSAVETAAGDATTANTVCRFLVARSEHFKDHYELLSVVRCEALKQFGTKKVSGDEKRRILRSFSFTGHAFTYSHPRWLNNLRSRSGSGVPAIHSIEFLRKKGLARCGSGLPQREKTEHLKPP